MIQGWNANYMLYNITELPKEKDDIPNGDEQVPFTYVEFQVLIWKKQLQKEEGRKARRERGRPSIL